MREIKKYLSMVKSKMNELISGNLKAFSSVLLVMFFIGISAQQASAHCDSYDGPTIRDAMEALQTNNVNLVLKWIDKEQEEVVIPLFNKTYNLRNGDPEVYAIIEKHFLETLVRLHRETEGASYTGLKPAGTTKPIIQLSDEALANDDIEGLLNKLNNHVNTVIREKYEKVSMLHKVREASPEKGRAFVEAYVDYTHSLEGIHDILDGGVEHSH